MDSAENSAVPSTRRHLKRGWRLVAVALCIAVVTLLCVRTFLVDVYYIPSESMEPTYTPGDRVLVSKLEGAGTVQRGDVVVFDGTGSFAPYESGSSFWKDPAKSIGQWLGFVPTDTVYIKRVIAVAGDRLSCCSDNGKLVLNGQELDEPYLYPQDSPSETRFDVVIPHSRVWVMGDHRSASVDSRSLLGAPGGGMIHTNKIIGRTAWRIHF